MKALIISGNTLIEKETSTEDILTASENRTPKRLAEILEDTLPVFMSDRRQLKDELYMYELLMDR
jgi:hypothetical protein